MIDAMNVPIEQEEYKEVLYFLEITKQIKRTLKLTALTELMPLNHRPPIKNYYIKLNKIALNFLAINILPRKHFIPV